MKKCKLCGEKTDVCFNVSLKLVPICESCASTITLQQVVWYRDQHRDHYFPIIPQAHERLKESFKKYQD